MIKKHFIALTNRTPFIIGPDLRPALRIGNGFLSLEYKTYPSSSRHTVYKWFLICGDGKKPISGSDLKSGCQGGSLQEGFSSLLSFASACAESWERTGLDPLSCSAELELEKAGENSALFPRRAAAFFMKNSDEISMLACEIEEATEPLIEE